MKRKVKVSIFLAIILVFAILFAIFALGKHSESCPPKYLTEEYERNIQILNDTIKSLRADIAKYKAEIDRIDLERENIRKELHLIIRDNEKTDIELANGDWDTNIKFLSEHLSEKDSVGE